MKEVVPLGSEPYICTPIVRTSGSLSRCECDLGEGVSSSRVLVTAEILLPAPPPPLPLLPHSPSPKASRLLSSTEDGLAIEMSLRFFLLGPPNYNSLREKIPKGDI